MLTNPIFKGILSCTVFLFIVISAISVEPRPLTVESNHSTIQFIVPISNGITRITGKFTDYTIDIDYVDEDFTKSKFTTVIKVESINTGIPGRDEHLRTADFFDVEQFPEITYTSHSIDQSGSDYIMHGTFTMRGVTKDLSIPLRITGQGGENNIGFSSRFTINRIDYGVGAGFKHTTEENFLSDTIDIEIDFWTKKRKTKTSKQ